MVKDVILVNGLCLENKYPGIQFRLPCTPPGQFFMGAKLFIGTPWVGNEGVLKKILVWAM